MRPRHHPTRGRQPSRVGATSRDSRRAGTRRGRSPPSDEPSLVRLTTSFVAPSLTAWARETRPYWVAASFAIRRSSEPWVLPASDPFPICESIYHVRGPRGDTCRRERDARGELVELPEAARKDARDPCRLVPGAARRRPDEPCVLQAPDPDPICESIRRGGGKERGAGGKGCVGRVGRAEPVLLTEQLLNPRPEVERL